MPYTFDESELLAEAHMKGYQAQKASLQRKGAKTRQHNAGAKKPVVKKSAAKKTSAKQVSAKPVKKAAVKKSSATTKKS